MLNVAEIRQAEREAFQAIAYFNSNRRQIEIASRGDLTMVAAGVPELALSPKAVTPARDFLIGFAEGIQQVRRESAIRRLEAIREDLERRYERLGDRAFDAMAEMTDAKAILDAVRLLYPKRTIGRLDKLIDNARKSRLQVEAAVYVLSDALQVVSTIIHELRKAN